MTIKRVVRILLAVFAVVATSCPSEHKLYLLIVHVLCGDFSLLLAV